MKENNSVHSTYAAAIVSMEKHTSINGTLNKCRLSVTTLQNSTNCKVCIT